MAIISRIKGFITQARRVVLVSTKPDRDEFKLASKITAIGTLVIGFIGFIVFLLFHFIGGI